ncbi:MAG: hypothetical protein HY822_10095 [Acidobacteria bacterium]|nr:hypothetical protein [Acidobacteriota bacterium]
MAYRFVLPLAFLPAFCLAQTPPIAASQSVLEELKGIRASLERLEKSQTALAALTRILIDQSRFVTLDAQRRQLSSEEESLKKQVEGASRALEAPAQVLVQSADGSVQPTVQADAGPLRERLAQAASALREVQRARLPLEQEAVKLKDRIAAMEKHLGEAIR